MLALSGCTRRCREGTLFLTISYDAASAGADQVTVRVTQDGAAPHEFSIGAARAPMDTVEVQFAAGYPRGATVTVDVSATSQGHEVGRGHQTVRLDEGCTALEIGTQPPAPPDLGDTGWIAQTSGTSATLMGVWGSGESDVHVVGAGVILHSGGDGTWSLTSTPVELRAVWGRGPKQVYAVGASASYYYTNTDGTWRMSGFGGSANLNGIYGDSSGLFIVADAGTVLFGDGGSFEAEVSNAPGGGDLRGVWGSGVGDVWAVGALSGQLLHSTTVRTVPGPVGTWATQPSGTSGTLIAISGNAVDNAYAVGADGHVVHLGAGAAWEAQASGSTSTLNGVWVSPSGHVYAVGTSASGAGVLLTSSGDGVWGERTIAPVGLRAVWGASDSDVYVVGDAGTLLHGP
jgi:hypothetical protein